MAVLHAGELARLLVDTARVYGPDAATDAYDVLLLSFPCRLSARSGAVLATGVGPVRTSYFHLMYPPTVTLPDGYWEIDIAGTRYAPQANSGTQFRDLKGNTIWRGVDLDQIGGSLH